MNFILYVPYAYMRLEILFFYVSQVFSQKLIRFLFDAAFSDALDIVDSVFSSDFIRSFDALDIEFFVCYDKVS
ncbi:MAG: hypothetical protein WA364_24345, partial [Candidatus Nitrosopolaris sp.]